MEKRVANILLLFAIVVLFIGGTRGYFTYDYFSLWGTHAKWVWSTGHFFTSGAEIPTHLSYQSILGSVTGLLARIFSRTHYPDFLLGLINAVGVFVLGWINLKVLGSFKSNLHKLFFIFVLFMSYPIQWGQGTFGGMSDIISSLALTLALVGLAKEKIIIFSCGVFLSLALRMPIYPFLVIALFAFFVLSKKKYFALISATIFVLSFFVVKWLYSSTEFTPLSFLYGLTNYSLAERLKYPIHFFLAQNGLMGLALIFTFLNPNKNKFWLIYFLGGFLYLLLVYTILIGRSSGELYASIGRYILPLFIPWLYFFCCGEKQIQLTVQGWPMAPRKQYLLYALTPLLLVALAARSVEEFLILKRDGGLVKRSVLCDPKSPSPDCELAQKVSEHLKNQKGDCDVFIWQDAVMTLPFFRLSYMLLPYKVYFPQNQNLLRKNVCTLTYSVGKEYF